MKLDREQITQYQAVLSRSRADPIVDALHKLALHHREDARDRMEESVDHEQMLAAQGDARAWRKVLKYLTDKPLSKV